jgi:putative hydrolases of HD superfamily
MTDRTTAPAAVSTILDFLRLSEALKRELRHSWLSDGRRESVAEHSWQMALMAILAHPHLDQPADLGRTLEMIVVHDLVEALVGDVPYFDTGERKRLKKEREAAAIEEIRERLGPPTGDRIRELFLEFEERSTPEARFAGALDNLEVQIQHNLADLSTWTPAEHPLIYDKIEQPCAYDRFLTAVCKAIQAEAEAKLRAGGIEPDRPTAAPPG